ncbi:unnamed protein product [Calypogeia fissa]
MADLAATAQSPTYTDELNVLHSINTNAWLNITGPDPCQDAWPGVTCDGGAPEQHVTGINLNGTGGIIPVAFFSSISSLPRLDTLSLANCSLTGDLDSTLSDSLSNLSSSIRFLDLSWNQFVGAIPKVLGRFQVLNSLSLAQNQLLGPVPEEICTAKSMTVLILGGNALEGLIPPCLGNLSSLNVLNISCNNLNGGLPESLGDLKALTELDLGVNSLSGPLPGSLTGLSNLTKLHLSGNFLDGFLPVDFNRIGKLEELYLDSNQFTGPIPTTICSVRSLKKLRLFDNQLTGPIPENIGNLTELTVLFLHVNQLSGPLPLSLGNLTLLQELQLQGNKLNGTLPRSIWPQLTSLQSLYLHFNELEGGIPSEILFLGSTLTNISLGFNKFNGTLPDPQNAPKGVPHMAKLSLVSLCNNSLMGFIPQDMSQLGNLQFLDFSNNQLTGSIPSQLTTLINSNRVQANLVFNDFDPASWSTIQGSSQCTQLLNESMNQQCLSYGSSTGVGINVGGPQISSEGTGVRFVADDKFTSLLGSYEFSSDNNSGTTPWVMSEQGVVQESGSSILTSSASPPPGPLGVVYQSQSNSLRDLWTLFQTARVGGDTLSYRIGHLTPGSYFVDLYFAELDESVTRSGQRVFSVYIQGELKYASLDIFNSTGGTMIPLILHFPVSISHGVIEVQLVGRGSWSATQEQMKVYRGPILSALNIRQNEQKSKTFIAIVAAVAGGSVFGLAVLLLVCVRCVIVHRRKSRRRAMRVCRSNMGLLSFTYAQLEASTNKFSERNLLGQGAFGKVFKGVLKDGGTIAIKQLSLPNPATLESLQNELLVISTVRHRNLVPLIGCCLEHECPIIVCQYMPNGNLHDAIFKDSSPVFLSWNQRCKVALDIARGLRYLHEESVHKIVHRDVKPVNILLDNQLSAHIADFGMARLLAEQEIEVITGVMGTRGYMAPEYALNGQLSDKVDVYSFGVVLLEMVVGRRGMQPSVTPTATEKVPLCQWAWHMFLAGDFEEMVDKRLGKDYVLNEVITMLQIAFWCIEYSQSLRPSMSQVMRMLNNQAAVPPLPEHRKGYGGKDLPNFSRPFETHRWEQYLSAAYGDQGPSQELSLSRSWEYSGSDVYSLEGR